VSEFLKLPAHADFPAARAMQSLYHADGDQTGLRDDRWGGGRLVGGVHIAHSQEWLCYFRAAFVGRSRIFHSNSR